MALSYNLGYQESISVHPTRRQIFAGKPYSTFPNIWEWVISVALPHQAGIELSDFHARVWKSDQGSRNSMQEMHGNQTKCMELQPIKENSNFWTSIFCPGINFSCSKSLWIWWTIDPLILACLKLTTYASISTKQLLAVLMDGNPCTNG